MNGMDYIPAADNLFDAWQLNFVEKVNLYKSTWNWPADVNTEWLLLTTTVDVKKIAWDKSWLKVASKEFEHKDVVKKNAARKSYESGDVNNPEDTSVRLFIARHIRNNPKVTADQKADMGLTVPDHTKTPSPGPGANSVCTGCIKTMGHLVHRSSVTTPGVESKGKEPEVDAIEVHMAFTAGDVKETPDPKEFTPDGEAKRAVYVKQFDESMEGKRAHYKARKRYKGRVKTYGPFSNPWSALIS